MNQSIKKIESEYVEALKNKDEAKISTLRLLKNTIKNKEIEQQKEVNEQQIIQIVQKEINQRKESINEFKKGDRSDLIQKEDAEIKILEKYLPEQLSDSELEKIIIETIKEQNANSKQDFGKVMQTVIPKVAGKADNQKIAQIAQKYLK